MGKIIFVFLLTAANLFSLMQPASSQDDPWSKYFKAGTEAQRQGRFQDSIKQLNAALKEAEKSGAPNERLAQTLTALGSSLQMIGKYADAEQMFIRALETNIKIPAPDDEIILSFLAVGGLYEWVKRPELAIPWYEKALEFAEKRKGPEATIAGLIRYNIADVYFKLEQYDKAEPLYLGAIAIYEKGPLDKRSNAVRILESYIEMLKKMNRKAEIKEAEKRLKEIRASYKGK